MLEGKQKNPQRGLLTLETRACALPEAIAKAYVFCVVSFLNRACIFDACEMHFVERANPPYERQLRCQLYLSGKELGVIILQYCENLICGLFELFFAKCSSRILEISDLNHGANASWTETKLLLDAILKKLNPPSQELLALGFIAKGLLVELIVLENPVDIVATCHYQEIHGFGSLFCP